MGNQIKIGWAASNGTGETAATSIDSLTDDLLELVLLHVHSSACLVRAAATSRLWRRVIAGAGFLRRFRLLHPPHVVGYYLTTEIPGSEILFVDDSRPGTTTDPIDDHRPFSFSLDFLPHRTDSLRLIDSRGGLLAFADKYNGIVVCDPCTRQHAEVGLPSSGSSCISAFLLLDADADTTPLMSRFRVLYVQVQHYIDGQQRAQVYVSSARGDRWVLLGGTAAGDIVSAAMRLHHKPNNRSHATHMYLLGRTGGCVFWGIPLGNNDVLTLDERTGEFSLLVLPEPEPAGANDEVPTMCHRSNVRAISGDARTVRLVRTVGDDLEVLTVVRDGGTCVVERRVSLSRLANIVEETRSWSWSFMDTAPAAGPGFVVVSPDYYKNMWMFSVETMTLEPLAERTWDVRVFPYELSWPPTIKGMPVVR